MKYRAKGLVFVGFAAAILASAGGAQAANPTGAADVVTSQKYTEATYQHILGGSNTSGKLVQMNSNDTGDVKYIAISDSASDVDSSATAGGLVSGRAVGLAMDELESALNNFTTNLSGDGTYTTVQQVAANGDNPNAPGYVPAHKEVQIITNNLAKTSADVTSTATGAGDKLATASAVKAYADTKVATQLGAAKVGNTDSTDKGKNVQIDANGQVAMVAPTSTSAGVGSAASGSTTLVTDYAVKAYADTKVATQLGAAASGGSDSTDKGKNLQINENGQVAMVAPTSTASGVTGAGSTSTNLVTDYAVQQYVQGITHGITLPTMPADCGTTGKYCALVVTGTGSQQEPTYTMAWTVMANP